ncbi:IS110 family transposase, partial [Bacillus wiedmannii]
LDVSSQDAKICFLNGEGDCLQSFTITNDLPGALILKKKILDTASKSNCKIIKIGLESTSIYSYHPAMFLHNDKELRTYGSQVFMINPKQISNFKKSYPEMDKTDA